MQSELPRQAQSFRRSAPGFLDGGVISGECCEGRELRRSIWHRHLWSRLGDVVRKIDNLVVPIVHVYCASPFHVTGDLWLPLQIYHVNKLNTTLKYRMVIIVSKEIGNLVRTNKSTFFIKWYRQWTVTCSNLQNRIIHLHIYLQGSQSMLSHSPVLDSEDQLQYFLISSIPLSSSVNDTFSFLHYHLQVHT